MEVNFRLILGILSVVAICAIYINGRLKIRKNKNPYKLNSTPNADEVDGAASERTFDHDGFDQDGIGKVKPVVTEPIIEPEPPLSSTDDDAPLSESERPTKQDIEQIHHNYAPVVDDADYQLEPVSATQTNTKAAPVPSNTVMNEDPLFADMPTISAVDEHPKPARSTTPQTAFKNTATAATKQADVKTKTKSKAELKRDQLEIDFDAQNGAKAVELEQEVLALSVVVNELAPISGAPLLQNLLTLGLKFGEMNIFHRHQDNAGKGPITFSLANMVNPGTFDLDNIENFTTQGVTLFMTLPNAGEPAKVFKLMLSAARQLAKEFNGQVLDSKRSVMTPQTEQHYLSKIREFDRKSRLAGF